MPKVKFCMKTLSSVINFSENNNKIFAIKNGLIYFLDTKKLDKILSLMCLLGDFNEYYNNLMENNVTQWLKDRKLLTSEILEEVSLGIRECTLKEEIGSVFLFGNDFSDERLIFGKFIRESLFNMAVFDYIKENQKRIKEYVFRMLCFFQKNGVFEKKQYPFHFFINCLFETEKARMYNHMDFDFNFEIEYFLDKEIFRYFNIEKIANKKEEYFFETIKPESFFEFEILYNTNNKFFSDIEKYLQISEYLSKQRREFEQKIFVGTNIFQDKEEYFWHSSMSIMNLNQVFYMNMSEENKDFLNKLLPYKIGDLIFYYKKNSEKILEKINYIRIKKEI